MADETLSRKARSLTIACNEQEEQLKMLLAFLVHVAEYSTLQ